MKPKATAYVVVVVQWYCNTRISTKLKLNIINYIKRKRFFFEVKRKRFGWYTSYKQIMWPKQKLVQWYTVGEKTNLTGISY